MRSFRTDPSRILRLSAVSSTVVRSVQIVCSLLSVPLIVNGLGGVSQYGVWITFSAIMTLLSLSDLGVGVGLSRIIARVAGGGRHVDLPIRSVFYVELLSAFFIVTVSVLAFRVIPNFFDEVIDKNELSAAFLIMGAATAISMPLRLGVSILTGFQKYGLHLAGDAARAMVGFLMIVTFTVIGDLTFLAMSIIYSLSLFLGRLVDLILAYRVSGPWYLLRKSTSTRMIFLSLDLGKASLVVTASVAISVHGTSVCLGFFGDPEWAGLWALAVLAATQVSHIGASLTAPITTLAAELGSRRNGNLLYPTIINVSLIIVAVVSIMFSGVVFMGAHIIPLVLPSFQSSEQIALFIDLTAALIFLLLFTLPFITVRSFLLGTHNHWAVARWNFFASGLSAITLFFSLPFLGVWAAVLARGVFGMIPSLFLYFPLFLEILRHHRVVFYGLYICAILIYPVAVGFFLNLWFLSYFDQLFFLIFSISFYIVFSSCGLYLLFRRVALVRR